MPPVAVLRSAERIMVIRAECRVSLIEVVSVCVFTGTERMNVTFFPESNVEPTTELLSKEIVVDSGSFGSLRSPGSTGHVSVPSHLGDMGSDVAPKSLVVNTGTSPVGGRHSIFISAVKTPL